MLDLNPTEQQTIGIVEAVEEDEARGYVRFSKLEPLLMEVLRTKQFNGQLLIRDSEERILAAFQALDPERKGYIESDTLRQLLMTSGERFSQQEADDMCEACEDPETKLIHYEEFASVLATE
jgi:calmodulin